MTSAAVELKRRIEASFVSVSPVNADSALIHYGDDDEAQWYQFTVFQNGFEKGEGDIAPGTYWDDLPGMIDATVEAVKRAFPNHETQQLVWRVMPEYEFGGRDFENDTPNHHEIYCRITAIPA